MGSKWHKQRQRGLAVPRNAEYLFGLGTAHKIRVYADAAAKLQYTAVKSFLDRAFVGENGRRLAEGKLAEFISDADTLVFSHFVKNIAVVDKISVLVKHLGVVDAVEVFAGRLRDIAEIVSPVSFSLGMYSLISSTTART